MKTLSKIKELAAIELPEFAGDQLYMHPIDLGAPVLPEQLAHWGGVLTQLLSALPLQHGTAYVTIDQRRVEEQTSHRRPGPHTDGNFLFGWGGNGGGNGWLTGVAGRHLPEDQHQAQYGSSLGGMLIASNYSACQAWPGEFIGTPGQGGNCAHLDSQLQQVPPLRLASNTIYWMNSQGIHESLPVAETVERTLLRVTLPADYPSL